MAQQGYKKTTSDHCSFVQKVCDNDFIILLLYVDGMLIVGSKFYWASNLKKEFNNCFIIKDLGPINHILSTRIIHDRKHKILWLSQEKYVEKMLQRFNKAKVQGVSTPLATSFKLNQSVFFQWTRERIYAKSSVCIYNQELNLYNGLHSTSYNSCSWHIK